MVVAARRPNYSFREYVTVADQAHVKLELVDGAICAVAGSSPEHAAIAANISAALAAQLRGKGCRVHGSDLRIRVRETGLAAYPDARWSRRVVTSATIELASIRCALDVDEVYHDELGQSLTVSKPA